MFPFGLLQFPRSDPTLPTVGTAPTLWLRADLGTDTVVEGASLTTWTNQQGAAGNAVGSGSNKPTYENAGLGGRPCVRFLKTTNPQHLLGNITLSGVNHTFFLVHMLDTHAAGNPRVVAFPAGATNDISAGDWIIYDPNSANDLNVFRDVTAASVLTGDTAGSPHIVCAKFDGSNSTSSRDGNAGTTVADTTAKTAAHYVLSAGLNAGTYGYLPVSQRIAEVIHYQAALSAGDVTTIINYLKTRYGIA